MSNRNFEWRRPPSLPPWETLQEPNDTDDEDDNSSTSSQVTHSSVALSTTAVSTATRPRPQVRPSASTQPVLRTAQNVGLWNRVPERLTALNTPGKRPTSSAAAGGMLPPTQSASQAARERVPTISSTQPTASKSTFSFSADASASISASTSDVVSDRRPFKDVLMRNAEQKSKDKHGLKATPIPASAMAIRDANKLPTQSQARPQPRMTSSVSAPGPKQSSNQVHSTSKISLARSSSNTDQHAFVVQPKASSTSSIGKGKGKISEVIILEDSDEDIVLPSQGPSKPKYLTAPNPFKKSLAQWSSSQPAATSTSSGDEFPTSLTQEYRSSAKAELRKKSSASSSSSMGHARREEDEERHDTSISQAPRKHLKSDDQPKSTLSGAASREKDVKQNSSDKLKAISKSSLGSISANRPASSQPLKRATNRDEVLKSSTDKLQKKRSVANAVFPSTQPASVNSNKAGPSRVPSQPASTNSACRQPKPDAARQKARTKSSASKPDKHIISLGTVEILDDDEIPNNAGEKKELVIDLTLDDDDDDAPPSSKPTAEPARTPKLPAATQPEVVGSVTRPMQTPPDLAETGSPAVVRPKPRLSATPKEKLASRKALPVGSKLLDVSRRWSDANGTGANASSSRIDVEITESVAPAVYSTSTGEMCEGARSTSNAAVPSTATAGDEQDFTSAARPRNSQPALPASTSVADSVPLSTQKAPEPTSAEPNFDYDFDEPMNISPMEDELDTVVDNVPVPTEISPSVDVTMQSADNEVSSEQAVRTDDMSKRAEETKTPIARARALRSPPISVQIEESQSEDANEVDLLLGPSIISPHTLASELPANATGQAKKLETDRRPSVSSSEVRTPSKPETLTEKLELLDLSQLASTEDNGVRQTEEYTPMNDAKQNEPSVSHGSPVSSAAPPVQRAAVSRPYDSTSPALTPQGTSSLQSLKDDTGDLALQGVSAFEAGRSCILEPFNESSAAEIRNEGGYSMSVAPQEHTLQAAPSTPEPRPSRKQAKFSRADSPGAMFVGKPTPNFMGMYFGPKNKSSSWATASNNKPNTAVATTNLAPCTTSETSDVAEKACETDEGDNVAGKLAQSNDQSLHFTTMEPPESASKSIASLGLTEPPTDASQVQGTPPVRTVTVDAEQQRETLLSPKSRAKARMPDVRAPRKLNMPAPTFKNLRAAETNQANADVRLQSVSSSTVSTSSLLPSQKEPGQNSSMSSPKPSSVKSDSGKNSDEAIASARKLKSLIPSLSVPTKADLPKGIPSPTTNILRAASSSDLWLKPNSMPYVKKRMMEQTMQSNDTSEIASPMHEVLPMPERSESASVSQPASPKRFKSTHTGNGGDVGPVEDERAYSTSSAVSGLRTSSEEVASALDGKDSGDIPEAAIKHVSELPSATRKSSPSSGGSRSSSYTRLGPEISAAPHSRFRVARKTTSSASQRRFRKRTRSISSISSNTSGDGDIVVSDKRSTSKRPRIQTSNLDGDALLTKDVAELEESTRRTRRSLMSTTSTLRSSSRSSASSDDHVDILDRRTDGESEPSVEQPTTSVTDLAGAVSDIAIAPTPNSKYPVEVGRYFINRDYGLTWYHVDDIPKDLVNEVNDTPDWCKNPDLLRQIFESAITMNTTEDEPESPYIRIINDIDEEPTPPFEFYYTNRMYHGNGVPPPNYRGLQGCDCIGKCDPRSKTCACVKRQRDIFEKQENNHRGFVYDEKGRVQIHEYPIFECNDACGCTEDCMNRVVQLGRKCHVNIVKTKNKGWGIFAGRKIYKGTFIGIYSGEILVEAEALKRGFVYNKLGKTYLFDIDFWHTKDHPDDDPKYCIDAFHVGNFTRFLNHSCDPNCRINAVYVNEANVDKALLGIFATKDIESGQEICFNYYGDGDVEFQAEDQSYQKCFCGARKCYGRLFSYAGVAPEEG